MIPEYCNTQLYETSFIPFKNLILLEELLVLIQMRDEEILQNKNTITQLKSELENANKKITEQAKKFS